MHDPKSFISNWVNEHIVAEVYAPEGDDTRASEFAYQCKADARAEGISELEIDAAVEDMIGGGGGLVAFMAEAMEDATDREVSRLAAKDD